MSFNSPAFTQLATDNFQRANENPLSGGENWVLPGLVTPLQIVSDLVESTILGNYGVEYFNGGISWPNDQYSEVVFATLANSSQFAGPLVRQYPTDSIITNYEVAPEGPLGAGTTLFLVKHIAGVQTVLATLTATLNPGDHLRLAVQGTTLSVYINGVLVPGSVVTDSSVASGFPGMFVQAATSLSNIQISGWFGGSVTTPAIVTPNLGPSNVSLGSPLITPGWPLASVPASNPIAGAPGTSPQPNGTDATLLQEALIQSNNTASRVV